MDTQTTSHSTNLDTQMEHEWLTVHASTPIPREWSLIHPEMLKIDTLGELLALLRPSGTFANSDVVFLALITRAQAGEDLAGRVLLQQLQPRCRQLLATAAKRHSEDPAADVYGAAWQAIATYPLTRVTKVRINLSMRVLNALPQAHADDLLGSNDDLASRFITDDSALASPIEVSRLLLWALDHDVITREEGALVYRASVDAGSSTEAALRDIANTEGVTARWMRKRYTRVVDKIAHAVAQTS